MKRRPARQLSVRHVRRAARASRSRARIQRHDGQADGRRVHGAGHRHVGDCLMARSIRASGGRAGDIVHIAYGYGLFTGGLGAHYGAERLGCTVMPMSGGQTREAGAADLRFQAGHHHGDAVVHARDRRGIRAAGPGRRATARCSVGIFGAEPWTEAMRTQIEARMGIDAVDIYGLSEVMGPGVANECIETKDGPVIWEDHFYPEIIDPQTGAVLRGRRARRTGVHVADEGSVADHPLSHARSDAAACRPRRARCAGWRRSSGAPTTC